MTFEEHKEQTAKDCERLAKDITDLAVIVRSGRLDLFEKFWINGGTPEGDAMIDASRELMVMRYLHRAEKIE